MPTTATYDIIRKQTHPGGVSPNLSVRDSAWSSFTWDEARRLLDGLPGGSINIACEAVDRHVAHGRGEHLAIRWLGRKGAREDLTYHELADRVARFASVLDGLGIVRGDRVFGLAGRVPGLYVAALGTLRHGSVFSPLFSAFGPEPIATRIQLGDGVALVTTAKLYQRKIRDIRDSLPLRHVLLLDCGRDECPPGTSSLPDLMEQADPTFPVAHTLPGDMALLHFTSGTTGKPKGAVHVHEAVVSHLVTGRFALDLHESDVFWCTADPGWVTGTSYGIISPLANGVSMIIDDAPFDVERWYSILGEQQVTVWYTAPTAVRMLMRAGTDAIPPDRFPALRFMASVGEPLNPEAVVWGQRHLGLPFHDNWWQTETGGIMIANTAAMDIKPGSMGRPLPSVEAAIVARREGGRIEVIHEPDVTGELALRPGWPSMFRDYLHEPERYQRCFVDGWYLSGDLAKRDAEGYYWFVGRGDDVIKTAGHLIGPFEIESALIEHPAVAEAAAIGLPDEVAGNIIKAFVTVREGHTPDDDLRERILARVRERLGAAVAPRAIDFCDALPKTRSGKIMRRLLRARELGLPEGDLSTLEREGGDDD
ncbi:MAG: acetate--CoA ligase [Planctomycetota bacterium]